MLTSGYELSTALTNAIILLTSLFCALKVKSNKLWRMFFILMCIDAFFGVIVHGFVMSINLNVCLWIILTIFFTITINTLLCIYLHLSYKHIALLSLLTSICLITQMLNGINFLLTFDFYTLFVLIICSYFIIKSYKNSDKWILIGFILQVIGGLLMIFGVDGNVLDHNGIYHMFMVLTLICLYIGIKRK